MKIEWKNVLEIALGVFLASLLAGVVVQLFAKYLTAKGETIHGVGDQSAVKKD